VFSILLHMVVSALGLTTRGSSLHPPIPLH
jgi:hypothetical protein